MNISEVLTALRQPVPNSVISIKKLKGQEIPYIPWYTLCELLTERTDGMWEWEMEISHHANGKTVVLGKLTIQAEDVALTRQATGQEDDDCNSFGDPTSNAEAMAFRRACAKFLLGIELWDKKRRGNSSRRSPQGEQQAVRQAAATIQREFSQHSLSTAITKCRSISELIVLYQQHGEAVTMAIARLDDKIRSGLHRLAVSGYESVSSSEELEVVKKAQRGIFGETWARQIMKDVPEPSRSRLKSYSQAG